MPVDLLSVGVRAGWLLALLQASGGALLLAIFDRRLGASRAPVRSLAGAAIGACAVLLAAFYGLEAVRMAGELAGLLDPELRGLVWEANRGAILARAGGLALLAWAVARGRGAAAIAGTIAVAGSFALTGHTVEANVAARAAVALHVLIAAFWAGSLLPLVLVVRHEDGAAAGSIVRRFTELATFTVPVIAVAGFALAYLLGVHVDTLARPYGALLLAKLGGFGLLMALAALNKWRLGPRLGTDPAAGPAFAASVAAEGVLIAAVLVATATLTTYFSPDS